MESNLLQLKYEDLLHFIISDLSKSSFFQNTNLEYLTEKYKDIKITNFLISNLENEYKQDNEKNNDKEPIKK